MDTEKYKVLLTVLETGNFTRAAEELGCTQSGVSHTIQSLEDLLGFPLLHRGKKSVSLTPNGQSLLPRIREIVQLQASIEQAAAEITGAISGVLRIGSLASVSAHLLPDLMRAFFAQYPNVEIQLLDGDYQDMEHFILNGQVDCSFVALPCQNKLECLPLFREPMLAILPKGHPLSQYDVVPFDLLIREPFVLPGEGLNFEIGRLLGGRRLNQKYSSKDDYVAAALVRGGLGVSILPELWLREFVDQVERRPLDVEAERRLGLATLSFSRLSPVGKCFVKFLKGYFQTERQ